MSGIVNAVMVIGVLFLAVYGFQHRDEILGMLTGGGKGLPGVSALPDPTASSSPDTSTSSPSSTTPSPAIDKTTAKTPSTKTSSSNSKKKSSSKKKKKSHLAYSYTGRISL